MNRWRPPKSAPATSLAWWRKPQVPVRPRSAGSSRRFAHAAEEERRRHRRSHDRDLSAGHRRKRTRCSSSPPKSSPRWCTSMKQMAAEMHHELEATRNELRRGVLEMPQEAAESTAQMRKVIVDQIEALAELNRIVARHGRGLDVVSARPRQSRSARKSRCWPPPAGRARQRRARARAAAPRTCRRRTSACRRRAAPKRRRLSPAKFRSGPRRMAFRAVEPRRYRRRRTATRRAAASRSRPPAAIRWSRCRSISAG